MVAIPREIEEMREAASRMTSILGLSRKPVGVRFLASEAVSPKGAEHLEGYRYCQALMRAQRGGSVLLNAEGISCPAAASAFGFRPLPEGLKSGQGLVGFGIVSDPEVGKRMFQTMARLSPGRISAIHLFPLDEAPAIPDLVVLEDEVERLMWVVLSYLHVNGGQRVQCSTAVLQATCVDATLVPYLEHRLNFSYGCYGCRDATDIGPGEAVLGFPSSLLGPVVEHLEFLNQKAIPTSRSKKAFSGLMRKGQEGVQCG